MTITNDFKLPFDIHEHLCLNAMLRYIDSVVKGTPPYFRQKDAEAYFLHPAICKYQIKCSIDRELVFHHDTLVYQPNFFDRSECPLYTNNELRKLIHMSDEEWQEAIDFAQFQLYLAKRLS